MFLALLFISVFTQHVACDLDSDGKSERVILRSMPSTELSVEELRDDAKFVDLYVDVKTGDRVVSAGVVRAVATMTIKVYEYKNKAGQVMKRILVIRTEGRDGVRYHGLSNKMRLFYVDEEMTDGR